ncbi:hypothetical protein LguiA_013792 [Lonicera macranthoides]
MVKGEERNDDAEAEKPNGLYGEVVVDGEQDLNLYSILHRLNAAIFFPNSDPSLASTPPLLHRIKSSLSDNLPLLPQALANTGSDILLWSRRGSPLRALLVLSVGTITLVSLTGLLLFMIFFLAATVNAVAISFLMSLAAAGCFLAIFFMCLTTVYVGALSVALFVISTATVLSIIAVLVAAGWIGFFWTVWLASKKSVVLAKHSLSLSGSALSSYSTAQYTTNHPEPNTVLD